MSAASKPHFKLSPEQERIVRFRKGHLQVIACAGSGKTEAISCRVASLLADGALPEQMIAFTFTERAAASLKLRIVRRVSERLGSAFLDRLGPLYVGTIHAYCMRMLQEHAPEFANFDVLDDHRQAGLLSREYRRIGLGQLGDRHWAPIHNFLRNADVVENELIDPRKFLRSPFGRCYRSYLDMLKRYHFLTYGQLIACAVQMLQKPASYARVRGSLRHLIVDEYQDINPAQEQLIRLLACPPAQLCVVGDDDQAIYQWRGSAVENILTFRTRYKQSGSLPLSENRRSRPAIIAISNQFSSSIRPRLAKKMKSSRAASGGPEIHAWSATTAEDEANVVADTISTLRKRGFRYRDIGILLRSVRTSSPPIILALRRRGIPFRCAGRTGLFLQPEAQVLGKTYAWLSDNRWKQERFAQQVQVNLLSLLKDFRREFQIPAGIQSKLKAHLENWYGASHDSDEPANLVGDYYRLLKLLKVDSWDLGDAAGAARLGALARFSQLLADFEHVKRRARRVEEDGGKVWRGGQDRGPWLYKNLFNYLQYYAVDAYEDFEGEETFDFDAVDILTVHQAKGLEWPIVFAPCLVSSRFPSKYTGQPQDWLLPRAVFPTATRRRYEGSDADERRLFYVAMTRARDMLYLSRFKMKKNQFQASPYLLEVTKSDPRPRKRLLMPVRVPTEAETDREKPSLSFSELAAFDECPLQYRLSSLLGFQPQLAPELGYGKAVHHILRRLADFVREKQKIPSPNNIQAIFDEEFYLPFANQAAYRELRAAAEKLVDKYLGKSEYREDLFRVWQTERPFELHLEHGSVNGRADVILDREGGIPGSLALVDYKTARDEESKDVHEFQLAIYAAAGQGEGLTVRAAYVHDLRDGERIPISVDPRTTNSARQRANQLIASIRSAEFEARPGKRKCSGCDVRFVCRHGPAR
ncbi:MAG: ATP-dependent helicase [Acidobacteria bacterium]|nr:ATP-dependent helicase [Acidobacteriota bacterium]